MNKMEIERKWLVDKNNIPYDLNKYEAFEIAQAYICFDPTIRIRKIKNKNSYVLTIKSNSIDGGLSRQEYEIDISESQYNILLNKKEGIILNKTRYKIKENNFVYEIDLFHNEYEGLCYLEIEFNNVEEAKKFIAPKWIKKELTCNHKYSNANLARGIKP